jgi:aryl-alcohol dehydrogenase-like predicted oxidoreductase
MPSTLDRRRFLKLGAAASGCAIGCGADVDGEPPERAAVGEMPYRPLGATGLEVSEVAFGAHGVDNPHLMSAALEAGINTFCTSGRYLDGREEEALGRSIASLGNRRDKVVILTGNKLRQGDTKQTILGDIDASLRRLDTDRIDVYYNAEVRTPADVLYDPLLEAIEEAKGAGKVLHLGMSGHSGGMQPCLEAAIEDDSYDSLFIKYDFVSYPDQGEILRRAARRGMGTIVFKTNAGHRQQEIKDLEAGGLSFAQATVKWALTDPAVASVAITLKNFDEIGEYAAAVGSTLARSEIEMLRRYADEMYDKYCRFCGTCEASCPHGVAVADVMRYAMYFRYYGREKDAMRQYGALAQQRSAALCDRCPGPCDSRCPFGRQVRAELVDAHRRLSFAEA